MSKYLLAMVRHSQILCYRMIVPFISATDKKQNHTSAPIFQHPSSFCFHKGNNKSVSPTVSPPLNQIFRKTKKPERSKRLFPPNEFTAGSNKKNTIISLPAISQNEDFNKPTLHSAASQAASIGRKRSCNTSAHQAHVTLFPPMGVINHYALSYFWNGSTASSTHSPTE
ncbi:hypothetical protein CDAR_8391 [Caerostris darwini]|uniref:Uncharacterized protein n=1 Tax=Caerostris darwini TaxID=1538125 RepID=A0AAV4WS34_9ARAC|nr:hypothetical protein CDAR_8391 [Caerostris darwini]